MPSLHIIYASTSGHTEHVVDTLIAHAESKRPGVRIDKQRAELTRPEDLLTGDVLVLATGTWNTGGVEGQLNPHMHLLLKEKAKDLNLAGRKCAIIALGDARYRYTCGSSAHAEEYVHSHGGELILHTLKIVNEPYGQEKTVENWTDQLLSKISTLA